MIPIVAIPPLPPPAHIVTIRKNGGGIVEEFAKRVRAYIRRGSFVRVTGECASSCTMVTALPAKRLCFGPDAALEFHQPFLPSHPGVLTPGDENNRSESGVRFIMRFYPAPVRAWITSHGGLTATLITLKGDELHGMFATCR